ncbi:MAG: hypothetical protein HZC16_01690 [Candidatus Omnitrophica bacterium]|nr:hypothetical protein [Candidatus Omnitrophota bacterium]
MPKIELSTEDKQDIFEVMSERLKKRPNWVDFHLFDLFFSELSVKDGELHEQARDFRLTILEKRPLPRK